MTEIERIRDQVERAFDGEPWCGPSLMSQLAGVSAAQASARVPGLAHSIADLVFHLAAWQEVAARRVAGHPTAGPEGGQWLGPGPIGDEAWRALVDRLVASHRAVLGVLDGLDEGRLDAGVGDSRDPTPGAGPTAHATLHGLAQHALYHGAQVALLKRLIGPR